MSEEIENYYGIPTEAQKPFKFANKIPTKEDLNKIVCKQVVEIVSLQQKVEQLESIRKEAIEYINKMWLAKLTPDTVSNTKFELLNILNKGSEKE